jgi:hypothetical protein
MKISIDIDMTPQELREFFGLPNVQPLQDEMLAQIRKNMSEGAAGFDPLSVMRPFLPENLRGVESMQKAFWDAWMRGPGQAPDKGSD